MEYIVSIGLKLIHLGSHALAKGVGDVEPGAGRYLDVGRGRLPTCGFDRVVGECTNQAERLRVEWIQANRFDGVVAGSDPVADQSVRLGKSQVVPEERLPVAWARSPGLADACRFGEKS
jgi:hypothetical protein